MTLIGRPAAAVPLVQAVAAPNLLDDPRQRARYAWEAFSSAMREIASPAPGWHVRGGEQMHAVGYMPRSASRFISNAVHIEPMFPDRPGSRGLVDRWEDLDI